ncbi:TNF receptor-associated factor 2-like isoform X2 [Glandiceps talaboti]
MAARHENSSVGYPTSLLATPAEKFLCNKCKFILRQPVQTFCGHRYCRQCFDDMMRNVNGSEPVCIACLEEGVDDSLISFDQMYVDRAIRRELRDESIRCSNKGCKWTGLFKDYEKHIDSCPFEEISCINRNGCGKSIQRGKLSEHLQKDCIMRIVKCPHCDDDVTFKEQQNHFEVCPDYPMTCEFCHKVITRQRMPAHVDQQTGDCERKVMFCEFRAVGCQQMVEKGKTSEHKKAYLGNHLLMLMQTLIPFLTMIQGMEGNQEMVENLKLTSEQQSKKMEKLAKSSEELEAKVKSIMKSSNNNNAIGAVSEESITAMSKLEKLVQGLKSMVTVSGTKISTIEGIIAVLNNELEKAADNVQSLQKQAKKDKAIIESLERKVKGQDRIIAIKDVTLAEQDLRIQSLEMATYDGVLVWKISNFSRKRQDAINGRTTSIYSPCFYTSRHGYKMCARIYLNGDGMGKGNHVSLFFVIMKGEFDALLRWPFRQKVTLMWVDQNNREDVIDAFRPDPTSNSFKRPQNDLNIASGCPLFMPLTQLDNPRHSYVKDDVAFLKIFVDTSDIN